MMAASRLIEKAEMRAASLARHAAVLLEYLLSLTLIWDGARKRPSRTRHECVGFTCSSWRPSPAGSAGDSDAQ